jgi:hypothetical protein
MPSVQTAMEPRALPACLLAQQATAMLVSPAQGGCSTGVGCGASGGFRAHPAVNNINEKAAQTKRIS